MTGNASGTAPPASAFAAVVARKSHALVIMVSIGRASRDHRLECDLDVDRQAGRAALIGLQRVAEAAVVVLVAAQGVDHVVAGLAEEQRGKQSPLQQPRLVEQEAVSRCEYVIHNQEATAVARGRLEQNGHLDRLNRPIPADAAPAPDRQTA